MKFLARVQGHLFLSIADDLGSAKKDIQEMFGNGINLMDLTDSDADFIMEVDLFEGMGRQIGLLKLDKVGH